jgi:hypothetical protein
MYSPIIIFNPNGLTDYQMKIVKEALDDAYRAGYETAKEFYQLKMTIPTNPGFDSTLTVPPQQWTVNNCSHGVEKGTYPTAGMTFADTEGTFADTKNAYCGHMFVTPENKAKGICGLCGISFDEWHG